MSVVPPEASPLELVVTTRARVIGALTIFVTWVAFLWLVMETLL